MLLPSGNSIAGGRNLVKDNLYDPFREGIVAVTRRPADTFGQRLARARLQAGAARGRLYTQTELAAAVGVTPPTVSQYEADASEPGLSMIVKLAKALGTDPALLAFGSDPEAPAKEPPRREDVDAVRERQHAKRDAAQKKAVGGRSRPTRPPKPR
jgi:transcriptional regulator with XRE-family HTH domain